MGKSSGTLVKWREYFLTANTDIFDIIERAIMVAAIDCPKEFKLRRDRIAELLFTCKLTKCFGCDELQLTVPGDDAHGKEEEEEKGKCDGGFDREIEIEAAGGKDSPATCIGLDNQVDGDVGEMEMNLHHQMGGYGYGEAEALTDEIEEESQMFGEVTRIKEILENREDESDEVLYDSLRRLQIMVLSVEVLKATEIGKSVNALRRHGSKQIRQLAKTLVDGWVVMVDEWMNAAVAVTNEGTPESMKKSDLVDEEEEGLPSPPLDEVFLFTAQAIPMELSKLLDGVDDDGNPQNSGEFNKNRGNGRNPSLQNQNVPRQKQQILDEAVTPPRERKGYQLKKQEPVLKKQEAVVKKQAAVAKPNKPLSGGSGPGRPTKPVVGHQTRPLQNSDKLTIQKRELPSQQNKMRSSDEAAVLLKLEASKRKLQERYQEAEKAKRQRTVQVMELHDIPKQNLGQRNPNMRSGNFNRHWANSRR